MHYRLPPQQFIRLEKSFVTAQPATAVATRVSAYMENCGYAKVAEENGEEMLVFKRGSDAMTAMCFTPRGWGVHVIVIWRREEQKVALRADYKINVTGQAPSRTENMFWKAELDGLQAAVDDNAIWPTRSAWLSRLSAVVNLVGFAIGLALVAGFGALGAHLSESYPKGSAMVAALVGGFSLLGFGVAYLFLKHVIGVFEPPLALPFVEGKEENKEES